MSLILRNSWEMNIIHQYSSTTDEETEGQSGQVTGPECLDLGAGQALTPGLSYLWWTWVFCFWG